MHVCDGADSPSLQRVTWAFLSFPDTPSMEFSFPYTPEISLTLSIVDSPQSIKPNDPPSFAFRLLIILNAQFTLLDQPLIE
jgi:hypothetical protein